MGKEELIYNRKYIKFIGIVQKCRESISLMFGYKEIFVKRNQTFFPDVTSLPPSYLLDG